MHGLGRRSGKFSPSGSDSADTAEKPCYDQSILMRNYDMISELITHMNTLGWKAYQADH